VTDAPDSVETSSKEEAPRPSTSEGPPEHIEGVLDDFNPFARHVKLAAISGMTVHTAEMRPSSPDLFEATVEPKIDEDFVDWEFLEKLKSWGGALKQVHVKTEEELDSEITQALKEREEQFILRNLKRVEMHADPDKAIRLEGSEVRYGMGPEEVREHIKELDDMQRVEFVDELGNGLLKGRQVWMRWLRDDLQWEDFFSRELKENIRGGVWRRAPDGPDDPRTQWPGGVEPVEDEAVGTPTEGAEEEG